MIDDTNTTRANLQSKFRPRHKSKLINDHDQIETAHDGDAVLDGTTIPLTDDRKRNVLTWAEYAGTLGLQQKGDTRVSSDATTMTSEAGEFSLSSPLKPILAAGVNTGADDDDVSDTGVYGSITQDIFVAPRWINLADSTAYECPPDSLNVMRVASATEFCHKLADMPRPCLLIVESDDVLNWVVKGRTLLGLAIGKLVGYPKPIHSFESSSYDMATCTLPTVVFTDLMVYLRVRSQRESSKVAELRTLTRLQQNKTDGSDIEDEPI